MDLITNSNNVVSNNNIDDDCNNDPSTSCVDPKKKKLEDDEPDSTNNILQSLLQTLSSRENFGEALFKCLFDQTFSSKSTLNSVNSTQNDSYTSTSTAPFGGLFPRPLDYTQPAKSWWRYYHKVTVSNTALCLTCGQSFNRGPKQSTTSLSHHLKMYHRDLFIEIQQAKDAEYKINGNPRFNGALAANARKTMQKMQASSNLGTTQIDQNPGTSNPDLESTPGIKKTSQNIALIRLVRQNPEIYNPKFRTLSDIENVKSQAWMEISKSLDGDLTAETAKKRWLQIRDRYRKELKFAIRDNFAYIPKWPYFSEMNWYDEFITDSRYVS